MKLETFPDKKKQTLGSGHIADIKMHIFPNSFLLKSQTPEICSLVVEKLQRWQQKQASMSVFSTIKGKNE